MKYTAEWHTLKDWKKSDIPLIKYFSGTAVYQREFNWSNNTDGTQVLLDLGKVNNIASVRLNGEKLGVLWHPPYRVDVSKSLLKGNNTIEIRVANDWFNRLIGDEQLPDDTSVDKNRTIKKWPAWVLKQQRPSGKKTRPRLQAKRWSAKTLRYIPPDC